MAKIATRGHAGVLEALVDTHHQAFVRCYPDASVPPKFHYAVHFPRQLIRSVLSYTIMIIIIMLSYLCITYYFV